MVRIIRSGPVGPPYRTTVGGRVIEPVLYPPLFMLDGPQGAIVKHIIGDTKNPGRDIRRTGSWISAV